MAVSIEDNIGQDKDKAKEYSSCRVTVCGTMDCSEGTALTCMVGSFGWGPSSSLKVLIMVGSCLEMGRSCSKREGTTEACSRMLNHMELVSRSSEATSMKGGSDEESGMAWGSCSMRMGPNMKGSLLIELCMDEAGMNGLTNAFMKESSKLTRWMGRGSSHGPTAEDMLGSIERTRNMGMANLYSKMAEFTEEIG